MSHAQGHWRFTPPSAEVYAVIFGSGCRRGAARVGLMGSGRARWSPGRQHVSVGWEGRRSVGRATVSLTHRHTL